MTEPGHVQPSDSALPPADAPSASSPSSPSSPASPSSRVQRIRTDSPWEETIGFAHAVAAGEQVLVSGTMPLVGGVLQGEGDPFEQAKVAFRNALAVLEEFGLGPADVIRTRTYLTHARDVDAVGRAHKELFDSVRPAATLVVVSGFVDSRVLVEVELDAYRGGTAR